MLFPKNLDMSYENGETFLELVYDKWYICEQCRLCWDYANAASHQDMHCLNGPSRKKDFFKLDIPFSTNQKSLWILKLHLGERGGSVVEPLTRDRRAAGSSLSGVTTLWSLSKTHLS